MMFIPHRSVAQNEMVVVDDGQPVSSLCNIREGGIDAAHINSIQPFSKKAHNTGIGEVEQQRQVGHFEIKNKKILQPSNFTTGEGYFCSQRVVIFLLPYE